MWEPIIGQIDDLVETERMAVYEASFSFLQECAPDYAAWQQVMEAVPARDCIEVYLFTDAEESCWIRRGGGNQEYQAFRSELFLSEKVYVKASIRKTISDGKFSVYCFQKFAEDLLAQPPEAVLGAFAKILKEVRQNLVFEMMDCRRVFNTKTLFFLPTGSLPVSVSFRRDKRLAGCRETSYLYNQETYELLPDDFKMDVDYEGNPLAGLFAKLEAALSACFLASGATIEKGQIKLRVTGQRTVHCTCALEEVPENGVLYTLYDWIYSGGNSIDKAIIARNIICLHCRYEPLLHMGNEVLDAVQSNYKLYLRDHVKQYLELKNRVAEFISNVVSQTGEYATKILDRYKSNMLAVFSFLFTVILADIVSDQPLDNVFTRDITRILEMVLAGSAVYMVICCWQARYQMKKVYDSYAILKNTYKGILTEDDIKECFQDDQIIKDMQESIKKSEIIYLSVWIVSLLMLFIFLENVSDAPILQLVVRCTSGQ